MSILAKYSLLLLGILLLAASCITGAALWYQRNSLTNEAILRGESIARNLAAPASDAIATGDELLLIGLASSAKQDNPGVVYAALLNAKGEVVGHIDPKALMKPLDFVPAAELTGVASVASVHSGTSDGVAVWDLSVPILLKGSTQVLGTAHVGLAQAVVAQAVAQAMQALGAISMVILIFGVGLTFMSLRVLVRPLHELSMAADAVGKGQLGISIPVRSSDEVGRLVSNFNTMVVGLKNAEHAKLEQGRMEGELALARSIQADLLPATPPRVKGLEIGFMCVPALELGGDFYDCIEVKGGALWGFLIADVSGKGVPAALHMANLRNLFRIFAPDNASPLDTLKKVNAIAYPDLKAEAFVTMIYAIIDPKTLVVRLINAGHDPAYWVSKDKIETIDSTAPPVGLADAANYDSDAKEISFTMAKGDMLFTFTDGVTEAMNSESEQFSLSRLKAVLLGRGGANEVLDQMQHAVKEHAAGFPQSDDITMLAVKAS
jgi:sigma-B regulation protein RsbU (phosphoserine phosphatase)